MKAASTFPYGFKESRVNGKSVIGGGDNPLLGLRDVLSLARREPQLPGPLVRVLDQGVETCSGMTRLLARLVEAHGAEEAGGQLQLRQGDLREGCRAVAGRLRATASLKNQLIALTLPGEPAIARVDAATLDRVLENLVGNALKFSPHGSLVELTLAAADRGALWQIEVCDEGPGIPTEECAPLFQKFFRATPR